MRTEAPSILPTKYNTTVFTTRKCNRRIQVKDNVLLKVEFNQNSPFSLLPIVHKDRINFTLCTYFKEIVEVTFIPTAKEGILLENWNCNMKQTLLSLAQLQLIVFLVENRFFLISLMIIFCPVLFFLCVISLSAWNLPRLDEQDSSACEYKFSSSSFQH